jgi:outer membrane protein
MVPVLTQGLLAQSREGDVVKIGVINTQRILEESKIGKSIINELEALRMERKKELDSLNAEIESLKNSLETQSSLLSTEAKRNKEDELLKKQTTLRRKVEDYENELRSRQDTVLQTITVRIEKILDNLGKEQGYTIILNEAVALYFSAEIDITDEIIKRLNAQ